MIAEFHAHKRGTTDWLNETITERYPLLVEAASKQLIAEAIAKMARQIIKSEAPSAKSARLPLQQEIRLPRLPPAIRIPVAEDRDEGDVLWALLQEALSSLPLSIRCSINASRTLSWSPLMPIRHACLVAFMEIQDDGSPHAGASPQHGAQTNFQTLWYASHEHDGLVIAVALAGWWSFET